MIPAVDLPVALSYVQSVVLGIVEGLTEYLPVSSTGHLTITEKLLGLPVDADAITAYTALIQIGAILATFTYFGRKILRLLLAWVGGLRSAPAREHHDYQLAWAVIVGSVPVVVVALLLKDLISGPLRSLWVVAGALILWSAVMWVAERRHDVLAKAGAQRGEDALTIRDGLVIGLVQCFSLIPGVSRSGATISAGLMRGIDRVTSTELSFFLAIPALTGAGIYETLGNLEGLKTLGVGPILTGIVVAFIVAYASIAWLLRFVQSNSLLWFIVYRVVLGAFMFLALGAGWITAT
ncbi:undecaprenyl-diphosphate phosphatase [Knoellia sp. Soil729]|uniref:undecaprenyl-diphosphate phosphatase n=1 Tax=Knoellia sp. Soil729 TaxID=1736394 RepID=UPI0007016B05|nr:undecaprenyl-diphosphate phosphatase [Knoellia sp. Soil729]KRE41416.1 UDP pyrophosphate phosphatase [Knoellia sp. Soil729]